ncbi:hypothetical protein A2U01_0086385, partial [Trifolium medium]|nr:hypothetical protein [Trifolium medium]
ASGVTIHKAAVWSTYAVDTLCKLG